MDTKIVGINNELFVKFKKLGIKDHVSFDTFVEGAVEDKITRIDELKKGGKEVVLYFDGNKNKTGVSCSYYIKYETKISRQTLQLKTATVPQAEYSGLLEGLKKLNPEDYSNIDIKIFGDSMLVINQVSQRWETKNMVLRRYRDDVLNILENLRSYKLEWISREMNFAG